MTLATAQGFHPIDISPGGKSTPIYYFQLMTICTLTMYLCGILSNSYYQHIYGGVVEIYRYLIIQQIFALVIQRTNPTATESCTDLLLPGTSRGSSPSRITRLHLQHCPEQILRCCGEKPDLGIWVQAIQIGGFGGEVLIDVVMVTLVVNIWRTIEPRSKQQVSFKLRQGSREINFTYQIHSEI